MNPRPEGMPWLTPYLTVADAARALDFYAAAFGFGRGEVVEDKGQVVHAGMTHNGEVIVMFGPESCSERLAHTPANGGFESPVGLYVYVEDVDAAYRRALGAGAVAIAGPRDMFWGDRMATVRDPDGYVWSLARHTGKA